MALLEASGLCGGYGRARVLFDVDLALEPGETVVLHGPNGAGKTTLLKTLMGLLPAASGSIRFGGNSIEGRAPWRIARLGLGYVPEDRRIFAGLTVEENLRVGARNGIEEMLTLFPALASLRKRRGGALSGGEQQMLALARTLAGRPRAVLLDEPTEGLAPLVVDAVAEAIASLKKGGTAILMAEQNARFARRVADRILGIERGRLASA